MKRTSEEFWKWYHKERWNVPTADRDAWERNAMLEWWNELEVGDHAHICHWSDVSPVTVIARTAKTILSFVKTERVISEYTLVKDEMNR